MFWYVKLIDPSTQRRPIPQDRTRINLYLPISGFVKNSCLHSLITTLVWELWKRSWCLQATLKEIGSNGCVLFTTYSVNYVIAISVIVIITSLCRRPDSNYPNESRPIMRTINRGQNPTAKNGRGYLRMESCVKIVKWCWIDGLCTVINLNHIVFQIKDDKKSRGETVDESEIGANLPEQDVSIVTSRLLGHVRSRFLGHDVSLDSSCSIIEILRIRTIYWKLTVLIEIDPGEWFYLSLFPAKII